MKSLIKANHYIKEHSKEVVKQYRNHFHLMAPIGWINDPNGFIYFRGEYHLFYQYYPYDSVWGPMHWGHAKSKDLLHWEHLPVALAPGEAYDKDGCFSGSAIEKDGRLYLMYTGHNVIDGQVRQVQCLAVSDDGITFEKYEKNPIIFEKHIANIAPIEDFRDPKVFQKDNHFYSVVASRTTDNRGQILLFESEDLLDWQFKSVLLEGTEQQGIMWECPDLFHLDSKDVLIMSPIEMPKQGYSYWNTSSTAAFIGTVDWENGKFTVENFHEIDAGLDFYAPQTCLGDERKRIMVAWMQMWHRTIPSKELEHHWSGTMTLPRELRVEGNRLCQKPIKQLTNATNIHFQKKNISIDESLKEFEGVISDQTYAQLAFEILTPQTIRIDFAKGEERLKILYSSDEALLTVSREDIGWHIDGNEGSSHHTRSMHTPLIDGKLILEIVRDTSSAEIFINSTSSMTFTFYEKNKGHNLTISSTDKATLTNIQVGEIE